MVLLVIVALFLAVGVLALIFGSDSRDSVRSAEHVMAGRGMTWQRDLEIEERLPEARQQAA
jgi:hypothetical protein